MLGSVPGPGPEQSPVSLSLRKAQPSASAARGRDRQQLPGLLPEGTALLTAPNGRACPAAGTACCLRPELRWQALGGGGGRGAEEQPSAVLSPHHPSCCSRPWREAMAPHGLAQAGLCCPLPQGRDSFDQVLLLDRRWSCSREETLLERPCLEDCEEQTSTWLPVAIPWCQHHHQCQQPSCERQQQRWILWLGGNKEVSK